VYNYLFLTAIGLTLGDSSTVHIYTQTVRRIQRTEQNTENCSITLSTSDFRIPVMCGFTLRYCQCCKFRNTKEGQVNYFSLVTEGLFKVTAVW
jgi:hypothetical protein